ncbi:Trehalose transport system permease protein SugA [Corynebacterium urogenitale]|uniref:Trehalose transport system permease protein SugA n=2 Tax=Corynebacterium urogenitale TaxID=2487892 RepID=A0A5J6Z7T7_9CORY|nr:Trehalose transport system permease protein SugA [Corynebacterium urogenitale]
MSTTSTQTAPPAPKKKRDWRPLWLVGPSMILLAIVIGYPVIRAIWLSFQADKHLDPDTGMFVEGGFAGLQHYLYWITNRCMTPSGQVTECAAGQLATDFWPALKITLFFVVVTVSLETLLGLWMALVMNRSFLGRGLLRAAVLVPWAIPTAVTAKLWQFIFADQGIINSILGSDIAWTTDPWAARFAVIIADVWKTAPFMALLILAGLQMVPSGVYEAARVDGASKWQQFTKITLPLIKPALMVAILFRTLDALRMYDLPVIMISESSNSPTAVISQLVITGTKQGNYNSASAMSTLIFLLIFSIAFIMVKFLGADVSGTQNMPKSTKKGSRWRRTKKEQEGKERPDKTGAEAQTQAEHVAATSSGVEFLDATKAGAAR